MTTILEHSLRRLADWGLVTSVTDARAAIADREGEGSTYVGAGMAIPHIVGPAARCSAIAVIGCEPSAWGEHEVTSLLFVILPQLGLPQEERQSALIQDIARVARAASPVPGAAAAVLDLLKSHHAHVESPRESDESSPILHCGYIGFESSSSSPQA